MKNNQVLKTIRERRSRFQFEESDLTEEELNKILEAGRWAPSFANVQPWKFIVIKDEEIKEDLYDIARQVTIFRGGIKDSPVIIAVAIDAEKDSRHYAEAGAVATQNMALAAHSLGISSYWVGLFDINDEKRSAEKKAGKLLNLPDNYRLISLLPLGKSNQEVTGERKDLEEIVVHGTFR